MFTRAYSNIPNKMTEPKKTPQQKKIKDWSQVNKVKYELNPGINS